MKNPQDIFELAPGAAYVIPTYKVDNDGLQDAGEIKLVFCKGDKLNPEKLRQEGVFTESIIAVAKAYLTEVNQGELATRETAMAITKLDEALLWIGKRAQDRQKREVQGTYKK